MQFCPCCSKPLTFVGAAGIVDSDSRWELQTQRYVCEGGHMLFIGDRVVVEEAELESADNNG
jgi:hypothetical protein